MGYSRAKRKKSNLTPQELICVMHLILEAEPAGSLVFKAIELADLRARGSLRLKCEYFDAEKVYRVMAAEDPHHGRELVLPPSGALAMMMMKELTQRQTLMNQELITCLYMAVLRRPKRQFCFRLTALEALKNKGKLRMDCQYFAAEKTFILSARPDVDGRVITPGNAVLRAMSGLKEG